MLLQIAQVSFVINLVNLIPLAPLDGGRALQAVSPWPNLAGAVLAGLLLLVIRDWLLVPLIIVGLVSLRDRFVDNRLTYYRTPRTTAIVLVATWGAAVAPLAVPVFAVYPPLL